METNGADKVICPCLGVTEQQVLTEIKNGSRSLPDLRNILKVATRCTGCEAYLIDTLEKWGSKQPFESKARFSNITPKKILRKIYRWVRPAWLKMASVYIETPTLHTRINLANLSVPGASNKTKDLTLRVELFSKSGKEIHRFISKVPAETTKSFELNDILPKNISRDESNYGMVRLFVKAEKLGSTRFYAHWYNEVSLSSTHEKAADKPIQYGFQTLSKVLSTPDYETYFSITNFSGETYKSDLILLNHKNEIIRHSITLAPWATWFGSIPELVPNTTSHLEGQMGCLYITNVDIPGMYYYFGHNKEKKTWQVQHL